ncbi:hypothetical protein ACFFGT_31770 [Mucilaginibacter angelicae]|uniref:DUF4369 domain-containing protein n=1 Tax=Mucilaginibacter angelicae TaxID=869718 RepID=A0ABV6LHH1_9SPHI
MNKYLFGLLVMSLLFTGSTLRAQTYREDYRGRPFMEQSYTDIQGNPFLNESWLMGTVTFVNGQAANVNLKYNIYTDELLFRKQNDSTVQAFVDPVKSFSIPYLLIEGSDLVNNLFRSQFPVIDGHTMNTFYQVIGEGKITLLRYYKKKLLSSKEFNSATTTQTFMAENAYYLFSNNQMTRFKPSQKTILAAMSDKADKVQEYIKTNKVDFKSDAALAKLFSYYSSL